MKSTWILIANGSEARLFETESYPKSLSLLQEFQHAESREKNSELASDKAGHYQGDASSGSGFTQGSFNEATDPKEYEMERFAAELAEFLDSGRKTNKFAHLMIASSPKFHGLLNKKLNSPLEKMVDKHINKDFTSLRETELLERLRSELT